MTTESKSRREAIMNKVRALLAKTVANGCTEEEAMAAAALADKLMQEHDLAYEDVEREVRDERYGARRRPFANGNGKRRTAHPVQYCTHYIAQYFDCKVWCSGTELIYFGSADDTELAHQMTDLLRLALDGEWSAYLNSPSRNPYVHGRTLRASFMAGMTRRLNDRLNQMKAERNAPSTGRALVVVKTQVVNEKFVAYKREHNLNLRSRSTTRTISSGAAYRAGQDAGSRVDLGGSKLGGGASARIGRG